MKKNLVVAALAGCLSFAASAQSFSDNFNGPSRLSQWTLGPVSSIFDTIFSGDDYLYVAVPPAGGADFTFTAATDVSSVSTNFFYAGEGAVRLSYGNFNSTRSIGPGTFITENPGPNTTSFGTAWNTFIPQGTVIRLTFTSVGLGMNIDDFNLRTTVAAVPEPGTYGLMLAGFGVVGFMARRRQVAARSAALPSA